jgi:ubiquinone biosynthesis protein
MTVNPTTSRVRSSPGSTALLARRRRLPNLRRLTHIATVLARHGAARAAAPLARRLPAIARRFPATVEPPPERLRSLLEELGGTFIKLGQMLALQPDILSLETCNALFNLLDRVRPFGYVEVQRTFLEDLGRTPEELFDRFEPEPLAAASIGQVHAAELAGETLAVKVRRPTVESDFAGDIRLMEIAVATIRGLRVAPLYWLVEPLTEFVAWTREELDYRFEARYMERLGRTARDNRAERVPRVHHGLTTSRLLVQEFLDGVTVLDHLRALEAGDEVTRQRLDAAGFDANAFARNLIENFLGDAFRHGIFHADLHPANLMILPGNVVGYLDFGITGVLSHHSRRHLIAMTLAFTRGDLEGMEAAFFRVSAFDEGANSAAFRRGLEGLASVWYEARGKGRRLKKNFTLVMLDMLRLSRTTGIWPERDVIKYIRSAIAIDGLITRFAPGFNVGAYLEAVCAYQIRREMRSSLLTRERLIAWTDAGSRLARDGPFRAAAALSRWSGEPPLPSEAPAAARLGETQTDLGQRAFGLAAFALAVSLILSLSGDHGEIGWNLFTAGASLIAASLAMLARTLRRLT